MCNLTRGERFKDARTVYNKHGKQTMDEVAAATGVGKSVIQSLEDDDNLRSVGYEKIISLAKHYGVTSDYLLGLSNARTSNANVIALMQGIGISEENANMLVAINDLAVASQQCDSTSDRLDILNKNRDLLRKIGIYDSTLLIDPDSGSEYAAMILSYFSSFINDTMATIRSSPEIMLEYSWIRSKNLHILREKYQYGFCKEPFEQDFQKSLQHGYAFINVEEFFELKLSNITAYITKFLQKKYGANGYAWD